MKSTRGQGFKGVMQKGFTLVELAIVLVIAGIILVGVLKGTDSINKAKVERMVSDIKGLQASVLEFQKRNNRLPGDCNNNGVIQLAASAVTVAGVNSTLDKVSRDPAGLSVCGVVTAATVNRADDLWSSTVAGSGVGNDSFNLPWNELRRAGVVDGNRTNEELGRHMFNDIYAISSMSGGGLNANVIVVYGIPVWMAEAIDAAIDGVATSYGDNTASGPACTGRVRMWAGNGVANVNAGATGAAANAEAAFISPCANGSYGGDRDAIVSISYQFDTMKLTN